MKVKDRGITGGEATSALDSGAGLGEFSTDL